MPSVFTRLYANQTKAAEVANALRDIGYGDSELDVIAGSAGIGSPDAPASKPATTDYLSQIMGAGVYATAARKYAEKVATGAALVVLRAPWGRGTWARTTFSKFESIDAGVKFEEVFQVESAKPRNIRRPSGTSSVLHVRTDPNRVRPNISPTPLSSALGWKVLTAPKKREKPLMTGTITGGMGLATLSSPPKRKELSKISPTPFSSMLGLPLLSNSSRNES